MSHTFTAKDGTVFIYNPDLSEVYINVDNIDIEDVSYLTDNTTMEPMSQVKVSGPALREFIGEYFRRKIIEDLERVDLVELFKDL